MRKRTCPLVLTAALLVLPALSGLQASEGDSFTLANGIHVYLSKRTKLPLVNLVMAIDLNPFNEGADQNGYTHIVEHLILTGSTARMEADQWTRECRRHGAYTNAHTDHDTLTLEISLPANHIDFAFRYLKAKLLQLQILPEELEAEKQVIVEEIRQRRDSPRELGTTAILSELFKDHPYGKPLIGTESAILAARHDHLQTWYHKYLRTGRMSLAIIGDYNPDSIKRLVENQLGSISVAAHRQTPSIPVLPALKRDVERTHHMDIKQAHLFLGFFAPAFAHPDQSGLDVLVHIFSRGVSPLLGTLSQGRRRLADNFAVRYLSFRYAGAVIFHFFTSADRIYSLKREVREFLKNARTFRFSRDDFLPEQQSRITDYLMSARNQILMRSEQFNENGLLSAISFARYFLLTNGQQQSDYADRLKKITSKKLREIAGSYFSGKKAVIFEILPVQAESGQDD